ncbi:hypothetical protein AB205_0181230 [Aquarana catesbeiana]|uniref:Uncharacterized protein n=1 Tax=Aquarana catesbeiana TaxID=8400 RepID=A0A2G9RF27_AQUCT|nr:hypothetical protein AB205_0181230 [Aquarana catesbeiana]
MCHSFRALCRERQLPCRSDIINDSARAHEHGRSSGKDVGRDSGVRGLLQQLRFKVFCHATNPIGGNLLIVAVIDRCVRTADAAGPVAIVCNDRLSAVVAIRLHMKAANLGAELQRMNSCIPQDQQRATESTSSLLSPSPLW